MGMLPMRGSLILRVVHHGRQREKGQRLVMGPGVTNVIANSCLLLGRALGYRDSNELAQRSTVANISQGKRANECLDVLESRKQRLIGRLCML